MNIQKNFNSRLLIFILSLVIISFNISANDQEVYDKITIGDTREKIIQILGNPIDPDKDLDPNIRNTFYSTIPKLNNHDSKYFVYWKRSNELYFIVGFNDQNKAEVKHRFFLPSN